MKDKYVKILFILIPFTLFIVFFLGPNLAVFLLGLNEWDLDPTFLDITADPIIRLFRDPMFYKAIIHNLTLVANAVFLQLSFAFIVAYFLTKPFSNRLKIIFNSIYFLPVAISLIAVALTWKWMYQPTGLFNEFLRFIGLGFLSRPWLAVVDQILPYFTTPWLAILIALNWTWFGMYVILFSAGMKEIPQSYFDAARIDGLSEFTKLRKIIFPSIKPLWFSFSILAVSGCFKSFAFIWATTMGGPGRATELGGTFLYRQAFKYMDMGYACTIGMIVALFGFLLMMLTLKRAGRLF